MELFSISNNNPSSINSKANRTIMDVNRLGTILQNNYPKPTNNQKTTPYKGKM
jgi:hypothetical protein